jgi:hypothetical protein
MANTTNGLTNNGVTTHYSFQYDDSLDSTLHVGQPEPARTNTVIAACENDFNLMQGWFGGIALNNNFPIPVTITQNGGGASWSLSGGNLTITINPAAGGQDQVRYLLVSEVSEQFMRTLNNGWYGTNTEGSEGEGLSRFLAARFLVANSLGLPPGGFDNSNAWLSSTRADFINNINLSDDGPDAATGCSLLFIYYLFTQLGFGINNIISAAANTLGGVYRNLTGDTGDPFPFFKFLVDTGFPGTSTITAADLDNPFPLAMLSFWVDKNTFGKDEVQDIINTHAGRFNNAFWIVVEGFNINTFNSFSINIPNFTGSVTNIPGISFSRNATPIDFENPANPNIPQRIRIAFDIIFSNAALAAFPADGDAPIVRELDARLTIGGKTLPNVAAGTIFELTAGADPYFTNIDPAQNNVFWLSQDLRVFKAVPALNNVPVAGGPSFTTDNFNGAFSYIQQLLGYMNSTYNDPSGIDPFSSILPGQSGALSGDSSISPLTIDFSNIFNIKFYNNYNFAIARVRLRGLPSDVANNVKVFFRLWSTQTADTDFQPSSTYLSNQSGGHPSSPLVGTGNHTIPFFATGNFSSNSDYVAGGINNQNINLDIGDTKWSYFGCFLNFYDSGNIINGQQVQTLLNGTHHCLVAEIASDDAPILNSSAVTLSPENSDMLAQRNLQMTASDNPGEAPTHRIPQTFDIRPSQPLIQLPGSLLNYPDELMIDWGNTPLDSIGTIYWPQVNAAEVINLANQLYSNHVLTASDANTIQCKVTKGVTYVPIPTGSGENFAGLLTIDLPTTVVTGQEFNVIIRRITTRRSRQQFSDHPQTVTSVLSMKNSANKNSKKEVTENASMVAIDKSKFKNWRYVTGTFQVKIPVGTPELILPQEQSTLAIFKWRLQQMAPSNRWYPVLRRYISYLTSRVNGLGGDADKVNPSPLGYWEATRQQGEHTKEHTKEYTGKISQVIYDCFGEFDGFVLSECCNEQIFRSCDKGIEKIILHVSKERLLVSVFTNPKNPNQVYKLIVRS